MKDTLKGRKKRQADQEDDRSEEEIVSENEDIVISGSNSVGVDTGVGGDANNKV